jgi:glyoxylase-like metal-dependent hydrolase (beta-lactamase superfamily II)
LDIKVSEVKPNAAVAIDVPGSVAQAIAPPETPEVKMDKLADGVWFLYASGVGSWAVEFKDYIAVVEGPFGEARSLAVNDAIRKAVPDKPIKYVVNTHAHYDHAGGLRTYVAQGITVITQDMNKPFFEQVWARPRTITPDSLSKSPMPAIFETVDDKKVLSDETHTLEIYRLKDSRHNAANLMVFLPKEGLLYYGDGYNPPPGPDPRDPVRTPEYGIDLYRNVLLRNLNVTRIAPAHTARAVPYDNLKKAIGVLPVDAE